MIPMNRDTFIAHLTAFPFRRPDVMNKVGHLTPMLNNYLTVIEASIFSSQLLMLLLRGASAADCTRYVSTRNTDLPFDGCEQRIFDELLAAAAERVSHDDALTTFVDGVSSWLEHVLQALEQDTGVPPTSIIPLLTSERERDDARCSRPPVTNDDVCFVDMSEWKDSHIVTKDGSASTFHRDNP